ncbi:MAG: cation:proton antiporter [Kiritimatiellae bacterium]|nr:cation:proton antiporter [Kiritimatiellia bacterium]
MGTFLLLLMYLILMALVVFIPQALRKVQVPAVVSIMLVGILIGPNGVDLLGRLSGWMGGAYSSDQLYFVVQVLGMWGLVFLMALAGMEVDVRMLLVEKKAVILLSVLTFGLPAATGWLVYHCFRPDDMIGKWVYASLFASHSVGIVFPVIRELGVSRTRFGVAVLGSTVVTDVLSLILLAVTIQFQRLNLAKSGISAGISNGGFSVFDRFDLAASVGPVWFGVIFVLSVFLFMAVCIWVVPAVWKKVLETFDPKEDTHVTYFLFAVFMIVTLGEFLGVNLIVGAFIAGLAVVRSKGFSDRGHFLHRKLEGVGFGVMIPFLFLMIGMDCKPKVLLESWGNISIALWTVIGLVGSKVFSGWLALRLSGFSHMKGLCAGLMTVPQLSATLAAAAVALDLKMLDDNFFNAIVVLSMVTTIPVPMLVRVLIYKCHITFDQAKEMIGLAPTDVSAPQLVDDSINKTSILERLARNRGMK